MTQPQAAPKGSASKGQRPRAPGMAYTAMVTALLVVVAAVALNAAQPPPPAIAEFAPQAVQQIKQSQQGQGEGEGQGEGTGKGACQAGAVTCGGASPSPPAGPILTKPGQPAIDVARVRACVGSPPRQTEDPQSPPCVPYFNGPNGGA